MCKWYKMRRASRYKRATKRIKRRRKKTTHGGKRGEEKERENGVCGWFTRSNRIESSRRAFDISPALSHACNSGRLGRGIYTIVFSPRYDLLQIHDIAAGKRKANARFILNSIGRPVNC